MCYKPRTTVTTSSSPVLLVLFIFFNVLQVRSFSVQETTSLNNAGAISSTTSLSYNARSMIIDDERKAASTLGPPLLDSQKKMPISRPSCRTTQIKDTGDDNDDPVMAIAFLMDPTRRYKKRRRPRFLSDLDRERRAFAKAALRAQTMSKFQEGQRAAERAIQSVMEEHNIDDPYIAP